MITMMMSIIPSDMALSPAGRPADENHRPAGSKAYPGPWFQRRNRAKQGSFYFGCSFSAAELMQ